MIGAYQDNDEDVRFTGGIDDVTLWEVALSEAEILALYHAQIQDGVCPDESASAPTLTPVCQQASRRTYSAHQLLPMSHHYLCPAAQEM